MKRLLDLCASLCGLVVLSPVLAVLCYLVWRQDGHSPFYIAPRIGQGGRPFSMVKLRSMVKNADRSGVDSTAANDLRITRIGGFIRAYKFDELMQLWNVLRGDMSLVGPRPNVKRGIDLYTAEERRLLTVKPGITDFASIVFSDEGEILKGHSDPDSAYDLLIRPWKSRLGLFYVARKSLSVDIQLVLLTVMAVLDRRKALDGVARLLGKLGADPILIQVSRRHSELRPTAPPGSGRVAA